MAAKVMIQETKPMVTATVASGVDQTQHPKSNVAAAAADAVVVKCECCGLTEECTEAYISRVRSRYRGRWICGLCSEAVKDEIVRTAERRIGTDEALNLHMSFCSKFKALMPPPNPTQQLISAVKQLLLRTLDSPRSTPIRKDLVRSHSCVPALDS